MRLWIERGFSRLPIAQRMLAAEPTLEVLSSPSQTPDGATPLHMPHVPLAMMAETVSMLVEKHHVDAFWPQHAARADLTQVPCAVHQAGTPETIAIVDDKTAFMESLGDDPHRPDQVEVLGADGVEREWRLRTAQGRATCVKPAIGVNGRGYWRLLEDGRSTFLDDPEPREMDAVIWMEAARLAERRSAPRRMLVMDWLPGPEVSLDLLCWRGRPLIHAARTKIDANRQRIESQHAVVGHARELAARLGLHGIVSMQYRLDHHGRWRMLEVNPRPAGGCIHSEDAGYGIITAWAGLVRGSKDPAACTQVERTTTIRFARTAIITD